MNTHYPHSWDLNAEDAIALQKRLKAKIITTDEFDHIEYVAGVDVGFEESGNLTRAAIAVLSFPDLQLQEQAIARRPKTFPYIPGLFFVAALKLSRSIFLRVTASV
jgi:deoxyribonuclease V